jgi:uncharacterized membrane protein (UPF0127 family)
MKKVIIIFLIIIGILVWAWWGYKNNNIYFLKIANTKVFRGAVEKLNKEIYKRGTVKIGKNTIDVEVAITSMAQFKGLSWRKSLEEKGGMLFVFSSPNFYAFWMKDMIFPLDIIWIAGDQIVDISKNLPPARSDFMPTYTPAEPANYVLEVNAGWADRYGIKIGDKVEIKIIE